MRLAFGDFGVGSRLRSSQLALTLEPDNVSRGRRASGLKWNSLGERLALEKRKVNGAGGGGKHSCVFRFFFALVVVVVIIIKRREDHPRFWLFFATWCLLANKDDDGVDDRASLQSFQMARTAFSVYASTKRYKEEKVSKRFDGKFQNKPRLCVILFYSLLRVKRNKKKGETKGRLAVSYTFCGSRFCALVCLFLCKSFVLSFRFPCAVFFLLVYFGAGGFRRRRTKRPTFRPEPQRVIKTHKKKVL